MSTDMKRSQIAHFLLTDDDPSDVWSLIADGIPSSQVNANPETTTEAYVDQDNASTFVERYAPTLPIEGRAKKGDAVFDYVYALWKARATGSDAEAYILEVDYSVAPVSTDQYPAQKQKVSIQVDNPPGGEGGRTARISYTINFMGDPVDGLYDVSTGAFTAS